MENEPLTRENDSPEAIREEEVLPASEEISETEEVLPASEEEYPESTPNEEDTEEPAGEDGDYYARLAEEDLAAIRAAAPGLCLPESLGDLKDPYRYGELREAGLSPLEAYLAVEGRRLLSLRTDGRAHLAPTVSRTAVRVGGRMATGELLAARDLFPSLSDGEIEALWRRTRGGR